MSTSFKFIIPLLDKKIKLVDLSPNAGFIDVFSSDKNRPYLDNHIFLLYSTDICTKESEERAERFKKLSNLYQTKYIKIKNKIFLMYVFSIVNPAIKRIKNNILMLSNEDKMRIIAFWELKDGDINRFMMDSIYLIGNFVERVIPEEDYSPSYECTYDKESGALTYVRTPL